jgi:hypothetical protein
LRVPELVADGGEAHREKPVTDSQVRRSWRLLQHNSAQRDLNASSGRRQFAPPRWSALCLSLSCALLCSLATACGVDRNSSADRLAAQRDTLARFGAEDQAGRDSIAGAIAGNDTAFIKRMLRGDSARTRWLQRFVAEHGWPRRSIVGDTAAQAAWFIVQHSPVHEFQERMLPLLEQAADEGDVPRPDVAMLEDRVRIHRGEAQRYGTQFSVKDGKLVPDSIADLATLDSLRAAVGMPPIATYVRMLGEMYRMPVVWPPPQPVRR